MESVNKRQYDTQQRRALAEEGKALPDGSFPIVDRADLANALQAIGRAANRKMAEEFIRRRAKELDAMDMLPDWAMAKAKVTPLADKILLEKLRPFSEATDVQWDLLVNEVTKAGSIRDTKGTALFMLELAKAKSFSGNRSAAGAYAASVRWGKKKADEPQSGASSASAPASSKESESILTVASAVDEYEISTSKVYENAGFSPEPIKSELAKTRSALKDANDMVKADMPKETIVNNLKKESRRLKSLSTRTNKRGHDLQDAEGGQKVDANGKKVMTTANRLFTDAVVFKRIGEMVDRLSQTIYGK